MLHKHSSKELIENLVNITAKKDLVNSLVSLSRHYQHLLFDQDMFGLRGLLFAVCLLNSVTSLITSERSTCRLNPHSLCLGHVQRTHQLQNSPSFISWDHNSNVKCVIICTDIDCMPLLPAEGFQMQEQVALLPHEPQLSTGKYESTSHFPTVTHTFPKAFPQTPQL